MMRIDVDGPVSEGTEAETAALRDHFREHDWAKLPGFIAPRLLAKLQSELRGAPFVTKNHPGIGKDLVAWGVSSDKLMFFMNDPRLLAWMHDVTGCGPFGNYLGRIYRMDAGTGHHDSWHSDLIDTRKVALTANLSEEIYEGGTLLLRKKGRPETEIAIPNTGPGDAAIFRLEEGLEHWISDLLPGPPKTAWAGWFREVPTFMEMVKQKVQKPAGG